MDHGGGNRRRGRCGADEGDLDPRDLYLSDVRELCQMPWGRCEFARYVKTQILHFIEPGVVLNVFMAHWRAYLRCWLLRG